MAAWIAVTGMVAGAAQAQALAQAQTQSQDQGASQGELQEVVVTAEKRTEDVQKTPIVINTATGDDLERAGALQLRDIEKSVPDLVIAPQGSAATLNIRGVYSTDTSPGSENADSINLDGAFLPKTQAIGGMLFDIQRVEVAEGPQGTIYGRNANGGAINIITNKAQIGEDSASVTAEAGNYQLLHGDVALNMAIGDTFAIRAAFHSLSHQGYFTGGLDDADEKGGRVGFTWKPTANESLWMTVDNAELGGAGPGTNVVYATSGSKVYVPNNPWDDSYYTTIVNPTDTPANSAGPSDRNDVQKVDSENNGITAQNDYNLGSATWTSQFSFRKFQGYYVGINNLASYIDPVTGFAESAHNYNPQHFDQQTLETRLASNSTTPLQWVAGLYGSHINDGGTMIGYTNLTSQVPSIQIANGYNNGIDDYENYWSYAAFGQLTWTPAALSALHLTAGGRYTIDQKHDYGIYTQFSNAPPSAGAPLFQSSPAVSHTWDKFTWKGGVAYDLSSASMIYATVSTGYEAGGYAYGPGVNPAVGPIYAPETITAYEIGSKNRFFNNTLQANFAAWFYDYANYQANLGEYLNPPTGHPPPTLTVSTAGKATYKGASADFEWAATPVDRLSLNLSVMEAHYGQYVVAPTPGYTTQLGVPNAAQVFSNEPITNVPSAVGNASYDHIWQLSKGSLDWRVSANGKGNTLLGLTGIAGYGNVRYYQSAFLIENTSLRYSAEDDKWSVTAYCNNIGNEVKAQQGGVTAAPNGATGYFESAQFYDPQLVGLIFQMNLK